jgi:hypothetical protein
MDTQGVATQAMSVVWNPLGDDWTRGEWDPKVRR